MGKMAEFKVVGEDLHIDGKKVLKAWESFSGWYWFGTEIVEERKVGVDGGGSMMADGTEVDDTIWYGYVQGFDEEWGTFSEAEIRSMPNHVWPIPKANLPYAGRVRHPHE